MGHRETDGPTAKQSKRGGRPREVDMREVLTRFLLQRSGCQWADLPHDLLPKSTVYDTFPSGATTGHGPNWSRHYANRPACK